MNRESITRRQAKVIPMLLGMSVESACVAAKVAKPTVYKWLKQDNFRLALKEAQDEIFAQAVGQLRAGVNKAAGKLIELVDAEDPQVSLRAASLIIDHAQKLSLFAEVEPRLVELEHRQRSLQGTTYDPWPSRGKTRKAGKPNPGAAAVPKAPRLAGCPRGRV